MNTTSEKKYKVLHVIDHTKSGGAQVLIKHLITRMKKDTVFSVAVLGGNGEYSDEYLNAGASVFDLGIHSSRWNIFVFFSLLKVIKKTKPDIIHAHLFKSLILSPLASWFTNTKCIIHDHTGMYENSLRYYIPNYIIRKLYLFAYWVSLWLSDQIIVLTDNMKSTYLAVYPYHKKKIITVANAVDVFSFSKKGTSSSALFSQYNLPEDAKKIMMVGRLAAEKKWETFIDLAKEEPFTSSSYAFFVVGSGPQEKFLKEYAFKKNIKNIFFLGHRTDIQDLLSNVDIFVLTSKREPFGIVILEAMAAGCPVISTRSGGPEEFIQHGYNGLLVDVGDTHGFSKEVSVILKNEILREKIVSNAFQTAKKHDIQYFVVQVIDIYEKIVSKQTIS